MNIGIMKFRKDKHYEILEWIDSFENKYIIEFLKTWYNLGIYLFGMKVEKGFIAKFRKNRGHILQEFRGYDEYLSFPIPFDILEEVKLYDIDIEKNDGNEIYCEYPDLPYYIYERVSYVRSKSHQIAKICDYCDLCSFAKKRREDSIYDGTLSFGMTINRFISAHNMIERLPHCKKANMVYVMLPVSINIPVYEEWV